LKKRRAAAIEADDDVDDDVVDVEVELRQMVGKQEVATPTVGVAPLSAFPL